MKSISGFLDIAKFSDFRLKNADVSRTQEVFYVIHRFIFYRLDITLPSFVIGYVWEIVWGESLFALPPPSASSPEKVYP